MRKLLLISLFAILVSASFVGAFSLSTDSSSYDVCRGSTSTIITSVTGSGSYEAVSEGDAALFTTTVPGSFSLGDGTQSVYSYVNPPSNTRVGLYNLEVELSSGGEVQSQNYDINVKDCHGSSLDVAPEKLTCACEETIYSITLENQGEFTETFDLSIEGLAKDWTTLSTNDLTINSGAKRQFTATVTPPCNVHGIYKLDFKAKARESLASASGSSNLDIQPCYEYGLEFEKESYSVCENVKTEVPVKIKNLGTSDNTFKVGLNGPKWVSSENTVSVASGEEGVVIVTAFPIIGDVGEYDLEVETLTENGAVKKAAATKLVVEKCHGISAQLKSEEENICNLEESYSYQLSITNSGNLPDTVSLELEGPEWVVLDDKKIVLNSDQKRSVSLELDIPSDVERKTYDINVKISSENGASSEVGFKLKIAEDTECYSSELNVEEDSIIVGLEKGMTFSLTLKNSGLEELTFKVSLEGSADGFSLINPDRITLKPGTEEQLFLFISPPLYIEIGDYDLKIKAIVKETGLTISENVKVKVVEKLDEKGKVVKEKKEGEENVFVGFFSKVWKFLKNPLVIFEGKTATEEVVNEETLDENIEDVQDEELVEEITEEAEEASEEEIVEEVVEEEEPVVEEEVTEEVLDEELVEETAESTETEEVVEESEEKEGFLSRILSFFQMIPKIPRVVQTEAAAEEEVVVEEAAELIAVEETEEVVEPVSAEEVVAETTDDEEVVEEEIVEEDEVVEEEPVDEEVIVAETTDDEEVVEEEPVDEEVAEEAETKESVEVDGTTVEIDLDALIEEGQEGREASSFNFDQFKWYLGGALVIIALVILLSTGVMRKFIGFFEEE